MTIEKLIESLGSHPGMVAGVLLAVPLLAWGLVLWHGAGRGDLKPWRYLHSALLHVAVFPGVFSILLIAYQLFMRGGDLLAVNAVVYYLPPATMAAALAGIRRATEFEHLPGFGRLRGFVVAVVCAFLLAWGMMRIGIRLFFFSSIWTFFILVALLYALLRWGLAQVVRSRRLPPDRE
jgi:hypothetical protein